MEALSDYDGASKKMPSSRDRENVEAARIAQPCMRGTRVISAQQLSDDSEMVYRGRVESCVGADEVDPGL